MMRISLEEAGKKFINEWIFRKLNISFVSSHRYAITGHNGSGKSTLLKALAGVLPLTQGKIHYFFDDKPVESEDIFRHISLAGPYLELIEEFTLEETIDFQSQFKPLTIEKSALLDKLAFTNALYKPVKYFSSGMRQKVKLALALYARTPVLMLDEPTANFDKANTEWYLSEMQQQPPDRLVIICSNQPHEYHFCSQVLDLLEFKQ